ncbi:MAG: YcaO-like family protein [Lachnospiraceae bacterium]|nr:YcaO-like family protein [Lachnospiraceae bacterium]
MSENNNRPYKCADPLSTINRVRQALERCGLFTIEKGFYHPSANVACSRVMLGDEELLSFGVGTNGKGMNMRYALASAYGEFLERLQNGMLFPNRQLQFSPNGLFRFGPDEILCTPEETVAECGDIVREIFNLSTDADALNLLKQAFGDKRVLCAPFADITGGCVRNVPIKLFYNTSGTNGMCAGNTPLEAIVHGISEIAERFAMREIYMERITPPIVPPECFEGTVIHYRLEAMRPLGYRYEIRDCSLGIGLPVIGLLLFNEKGEHTFHLGADPRAHVALERCLTEIFQGSEEDIAERFTAETLPYPETKTEKNLYCRQFSDSTIRGTGLWPSSLLNEQPSYPFEGLFPAGNSDEEDFSLLSSRLAELGYRLFIRDCSYLDFPAYFVYIPRMSDLDFIYDDGGDFIRAMRLVGMQRTFIGPRSASEKDRRTFAECLDRYLRENVSAPVNPVQFFLLNSSPSMCDADPYLITALFTGTGGDPGLASEYMEQHLKNSPAAVQNRKLCTALAFYWHEKARGAEDGTLRELLSRMFDQKTVDICFAHGLNPGLFDYFLWPECFRCGQCLRRSTCMYDRLVEILTPIQQIYREHTPDQEALLSLLTF